MNDEYKQEILKNPELILYYIFTDIGTSHCYTTTFHIRKSAIEDDFNNLYNLSNKNRTLYYNNLEDVKIGGKSSAYRNSINEDSKEENNNSFRGKKNKNSNIYEIPEIPEERKLVFSDNSNSSQSSDKSNGKINKFDIPTRIERKSNKLNTMAEVSESAEGD